MNPVNIFTPRFCTIHFNIILPFISRLQKLYTAGAIIDRLPSPQWEQHEPRNTEV